MSKTLFDLSNKSALITGATGYLGKHMSHCLGNAGAHIFVNSRDASRCEMLVKQLRNDGIAADGAVFDVTNTQEVKRFFASLGQPLHVLVNNAYAGKAGSISHAKADQYQHSYEVCVTAAHTLVTQALLALQQAVSETADASVINIASMYGMVTPDPDLYASTEHMNPPYYGAAKAALIHWSRYAAREFAPFGIRVNALSPGPFPSSATQIEQPEFVARLKEKVPLGRIGHPTDLDGALLLLASSTSRFITGSNIVVDGGWTS